MSMLPHPVRYTYEEYLRVEQDSNIRHEYLEGQIYAMSGGTPEHSGLFTAVATIFNNQIRKRCSTMTSDVRVRTTSGLTTYPDVVVVCGPSERDTTDRHAITNPTLLVEVLSRSTEAYDRGVKFEHYKSIKTLQQYVLVSQNEPLVEVWTRGNDNQWTFSVYRDGDTAPLSSVNGHLDVRKLYELGTIK
ncbi:MAG TPA: Uma2 family endonuclease [Thermoanaerobaculia bacterium]|nr:Uma2 family endonuclease [Thermoanaerobaculia bacterium]